MADRLTVPPALLTLTSSPGGAPATLTPRLPADCSASPTVATAALAVGLPWRVLTAPVTVTVGGVLPAVVMVKWVSLTSKNTLPTA